MVNMKNEEMELVLGCLPVKEAAEAGFPPYKNSILEHCSQCNREVWLGPEQKKKREQYKCKIICLICAVENRNPGEPITLLQLTDKKMGE